ncbi:MAG: Maltodextrin ABC transporter, permease protein MdxG, partial [uncultured Chloroflexia bacterium]
GLQSVPTAAHRAIYAAGPAGDRDPVPNLLHGDHLAQVARGDLPASFVAADQSDAAQLFRFAREGRLPGQHSEQHRRSGSCDAVFGHDQLYGRIQPCAAQVPLSYRYRPADLARVPHAVGAAVHSTVGDCGTVSHWQYLARPDLCVPDLRGSAQYVAADGLLPFDSDRPGGAGDGRWGDPPAGHAQNCAAPFGAWPDLGQCLYLYRCLERTAPGPDLYHVAVAPDGAGRAAVLDHRRCVSLGPDYGRFRGGGGAGDGAVLPGAALCRTGPCRRSGQRL